MENPFTGGFGNQFPFTHVTNMRSFYLGSFPYSIVGFAFIYMEDERDAEDAIRGLDRTGFGRKGRRLRVEWTKVMYNL